MKVFLDDKIVNLWNLKLFDEINNLINSSKLTFIFAFLKWSLLPLEANWVVSNILSLPKLLLITKQFRISNFTSLFSKLAFIRHKLKLGSSNQPLQNCIQGHLIRSNKYKNSIWRGEQLFLLLLISINKYHLFSLIFEMGFKIKANHKVFHIDITKCSINKKRKGLSGKIIIWDPLPIQEYFPILPTKTKKCYPIPTTKNQQSQEALWKGHQLLSVTKIDFIINLVINKNHKLSNILLSHLP